METACECGHPPATKVTIPLGFAERESTKSSGSLIISNGGRSGVGFVTCVPPAALLTGLSNGRSVFTIKPLNVVSVMPPKGDRIDRRVVRIRRKRVYRPQRRHSGSRSARRSDSVREPGVGLALCSASAASRLKVNVNSLPDPEYLLGVEVVTNCGFDLAAPRFESRPMHTIG